MASQDQENTPRKAPAKTGTAARGFASMSQSAQREIARMGGAAVSGNREHMAMIGRRGGEASAESRAAASQARAASKTSSTQRNGSEQVAASPRRNDDHEDRQSINRMQSPPR